MKLLAKLTWCGINIITFMFGILAGATTMPITVGIAELSGTGINMFPISLIVATTVAIGATIMLHNEIVRRIQEK